MTDRTPPATLAKATPRPWATNGLRVESAKRDYPSRTRQAFDAMMSIHRPKLWIFGHWHRSRNEMIDGTRFICLAELEHKDIDL